jgi:hypothetical protein
MSAAPPPPQGEEGFARNRAVVSDDGRRIRISVYVAGVEAPLGVAELPLDVAARLCADLAIAVAAHLARERNHRVGVRRGPGK